jgi:hypothetical protein
MNEEAKKNILRAVPYGLYVIGVKNGNDSHAFTGSWLSQCSMKPPRVMLGVRHGTHSLDMLKEGKVFSVNFLSKQDKKIFEQFFKPTPASGNRFGDVAFHHAQKTGAPVIDQAVQFLECEVKNIFEPIQNDPEATSKAGVDFCIRQCQSLLKGGAPGLHFYTLNKLSPTDQVLKNFSQLPLTPS